MVEHRIARLVQLGIRQARYIGRTKTLFQLLMAAAVANLTLLANTPAAVSDSALIAGVCRALLAALLVPQSHSPRPDGRTPHLRWLAPDPDVAALVPASAWPSTLGIAASRPRF